MADYAPIRSLRRGLSVLRAVNSAGSINLTEVCRATDLPYGTVFRIVQTLVADGFLECEPNRKRYRATAMVNALSSGFQDNSRLVSASREHIVELTRKLAWPISIATRVGNMMMVRDSTHSLTSLTLTNYAPGFTLPLAECSSGKVYLAYCSEEERISIRAGLQLLDSGADKLGLLLTENDTMISEIRAKGYATQSRNSYTNNPGKTSSIAVPIMDGGEIAGTVVLIFFAVGMQMAEAEARFVDELKAAAHKIEADL